MTDVRPCAQCGASTAMNRMFATERGLICQACQEAIPEPPPPLFSPLTTLGMVLALMPFVVHMTGESFFIGLVLGGPRSADLIAAGAGPLALALGVAALWSARKATERRGPALAIAATIAVLGTYHLLRGFALV